MQAIFFDMDGTLIDSRLDLAATVNHTRADFSLAPISTPEVLKYVGHGAKHLLCQTIPEQKNNCDEVLKIFLSHYSEHMLENVSLYPTVRETLFALHERGFLLGINTAKPSFATRAILEKFELLELFNGAIIAGGDCEEFKPSALPLQMCAKKMHHTLSPYDWMVGDHWTDLRCAENAGIQGAFCSYGFGFRDNAPANAVIAQMSELLSFL